MRWNGRVTDFSLPGYDIVELLGFGGSGEVWRARERASGDVVALKRVHGVDGVDGIDGVDGVDGIGTGGEPNQRLQREAALLATVKHEHVVRLRSVVSTGGGLVLVLDYAEGGSLTAVLAARGRLTAGEVVTIGAPLAGALAEVHARGLVHGDITPGNIVFDASGKPLLADLGVASLAGELGVPVAATAGYADPAVEVDATGAARPRLSASDVHGLAAVCFAALAGVPPYRDGDTSVARALGPLVPGAPPALVAAIESGLDPDPAARPDASTLGRALFAACAPVAVRLARPSVPVIEAKTREVGGRVSSLGTAPILGRDGEVARGRRRWSATRAVTVRRALTAVAALGLLAGAVAGGVGWAGHDHNAAASTVVAVGGVPSAIAVLSQPAAVPGAVGSASPVASSGSALPNWTTVLAALDTARDNAFATGEVGQLDAVYVAGSAVLAADRATLNQLVTAGQRARGLHLQLISVRAASAASTNVTLVVRDTLSAYDVVGAGGAVEHVAGRGERGWIVMLQIRQPGDRWRIASIGAA
jgi:eukaryotic-like serine/threonine-protein kinase